MMLRATLLLCVLLGACAGPRHLGARTGEAFAAAIDRQTRADDEALPIEITGEEVSGILAGLREEHEGATEEGQSSGAAPLMPLAR